MSVLLIWYLEHGPHRRQCGCTTTDRDIIDCGPMLYGTVNLCWRRTWTLPVYARAVLWWPLTKDRWSSPKTGVAKPLGVVPAAVASAHWPTRATTCLYHHSAARPPNTIPTPHLIYIKPRRLIYLGIIYTNTIRRMRRLWQKKPCSVVWRMWIDSNRKIDTPFPLSHEFYFRDLDISITNN